MPKPWVLFCERFRAMQVGRVVVCDTGYARCVRLQSIRVLAVTFGLLALPATAFAAPSIQKEKIGPVPTQSNLSHDEALRVLIEGERLLEQELVAEGMVKMLEAYAALEQTDGPEARGVKELRSWLVKALETIELKDEAASLRARGSYVDHPLSVMPSTWFPQANPQAPASIDEATAAVERGLGLLEQGDVQGLVLLVNAYEIVEREQGPESPDGIAIRSFLVGLLETGGFVDEANALRARGSVTPMTAEDQQVYAVTWQRILEREQAGSSPLTGPSNSGSTNNTFDNSSNTTNTTNDVVEEDDYKPRKVEKGSVVPGVLIDLGVGTFQPDYGRKGLIWSAGLELHWTLFTAKFFGLQLGGGGNFGRNRDKRWQADAHGELRLNFDFRKVYLRPEFGGGYDQLAGGKAFIADAFHVAPAGYYHFGGTLGVRFAERFGFYGRAVRLNRGGADMRNETRVRGGFLLGVEDVMFDFAFVFTDYDAREGDPGARIFSGNVGIRI